MKGQYEQLDSRANTNLSIYDVVMKYTKKKNTSKLAKNTDALKDDDVDQYALNKFDAKRVFLSDTYDSDVIDLFSTKTNCYITKMNNQSRRIEPYENAYKKTKKAVWNKENNEKFFHLLSIFGNDPYLIHSQMPNFTEKQIKLKFTRERSKNTIDYIKACENVVQLNPNSITISYEEKLAEPTDIMDVIFNN